MLGLGGFVGVPLPLVLAKSTEASAGEVSPNVSLGTCGVF